MKKITLIIALSLALFTHSIIHAQSLLREVSLSDKVKTSGLLIEGKVISKQSFWDIEKKHIYTSNKVEVYKVFKGNLKISYIEILTKGGTVGYRAEKVHPSLQLQIGNIGLFFLEDSNIALSEAKKGSSNFKPSIGAQSYYSYNLLKGTANGVFQKYDDIEITLYNEIYLRTNTKFREIKKSEIQNKLRTVKKLNQVALDIASFSPTAISAGTHSVLTIIGSDFGENSGIVKFKNADDGGATYITVLDSQIKSWSSNKIEVEVPDAAGTGNIQVITSGGETVFTSTSDLTVTYAEINLNISLPSVNLNIDAQTHHVNVDGNGGYIWEMHTDFSANNAANEAFTRAMNTWRCNIKTYWEISDSTTDVDEAVLDGTNVIRFDNGSELDAGTLAVCTSYYGLCLSASFDPTWYVSELDIVFDEFNATNTNGTNWQYGPVVPTGTEEDFETVAVHELGHGQQLGHVTNSTDMMHYKLEKGDVKRTLNANNTTAANDVHSRSTGTNQCDQISMSDFDCSSLSVDDELLAQSIKFYPNPVSNVLTIDSKLSLTKVEIFSILGQKVKEINSHFNSISTANLSSGLYMVRITSIKGKAIRKLIKE